MKSVFLAPVRASVLLLAASAADGDTILYYDSMAGGTADALDRLDDQTDSGFVESSTATTSLGSNAVFSLAHATQTHVQGLGTGTDKSFRFGSGTGGTGTMSGSMRVEHMENGPYMEVSFTAARDMILDGLSFKLWNNSLNASYYGARDAGLFVKVSGGDFTQFGESFTSPTGNGNQGTVTFTDTREVAEGDLVVLRIAFTDRTRAANDNQAATRIGAIDISATAGTISDKLRVISYNIHGGKGPDDEGTPASNLAAFKNGFMQNEDVICLQEVDNGDCWNAVRDLFPEDKWHSYRTINQETDYWFWEAPKQTSIVILSKYPFVSTHSKLVNTDPTYDQWERHAQHVQIEVGGEIVHIFNYHNTYDPDDGGTSSEEAGMEKFRDYVVERLGVNALSGEGRVLLLGDFNINGSLLDGIMPGLAQRQSDWVDHVVGMSRFTNSGVYATSAADLSDHDAVWASLDLAAPFPNPAAWESAPAESGTTSITMTAATASDPNGVEYHFSNQSVADGSHDSGWQDSPVFTDTGLSPGTKYVYVVKTRDKSANANESGDSVEAAVTTDDGDGLPNDWELQYFEDLNSSSGGPQDDWDNDGASDRDEWVAGTDPGDPSSRFRAMAVPGDSGTVEISWPSVAGKSYRVFRSDRLDGGWLPVAGPFEATPPTNSHSASSDGRAVRFFRVEVTVD